MHSYVFIFISVIALALCEHAVTDSSNGMFPVIIHKNTQQSTPGNGTVEFQTTPNAIETTVSTTETNNDTTTQEPIFVEDNAPHDETRNPFPKRRTSDKSKKTEADAHNKMKLKMKLTKTMAELKEKAEAAAKKASFPKDLEKNDGLKLTQIISLGSKNVNKYMPFAKNSKEARDNEKRKQLLDWLYNARPLLSNETKLWANVKEKSDKNKKIDTESQTEKEGRKSDTEHKVEADFQTVEAGSNEKQTQATRTSSDTKVTDATLVSKYTTTTTTTTVSTNNSEESDSSEELRKKTIKSRGVTKAKKVTMETDTDTTSEETIEAVTKKKEVTEKPKLKEMIIQRFAPTNDGPSSLESGNLS